MSTSFLHEFKVLPSLAPDKENSELEVSLIIPVRNASVTLEKTVQEAHHYLSKRYPHSFEIILVPNPAPQNQQDPSIRIAEELSLKFSSTRSQTHLFPPGKGAAIRTGLSVARGQWIFFTDSDLPYDLDFFDNAIVSLKSGFDLVTGNRRLPSSSFHIPVRLLPLAYGRHKLGLGFNQLVRWLLPIHTTDTQAGIKAMSRRLAHELIKRQSCPGFLFDLEIFLTALGHGYAETEFPVTLYLNSEKSTVRILRECLLVAYWLTRITWRNQMNAYGGASKKIRGILKRYQKAPLSTRLFLKARWSLTPYTQMASKLPAQGRILDLGCGHGLFALAAALNSPHREIIGIDHDAERISLGTRAIQDLPNVQISSGNMTQPPRSESPYSGIAMIDVMHYFDLQTQENLLKRSYDLLEKGGTLLVREVDPEGGLASRWNRLYEKIATGIGFTQSEKKELYFRSRQGWEDAMTSAGFKVTSERCSSFLFADILYICERPH